MTRHKQPATRRRGEELREWFREQWDRRPAWLERAALSRLLMRRVTIPLPSRGQVVGATMATLLAMAVVAGLRFTPAESPSQAGPTPRADAPKHRAPQAGSTVAPIARVAQPQSGGFVQPGQTVTLVDSTGGTQKPAPEAPTQERSPADPPGPAPTSSAPGLPAPIPSIPLPPSTPPVGVTPPDVDEEEIADQVCRVLPNGKEKCHPAKKKADEHPPAAP